MPDIASLLQQGVTNYWLFIPAAILLGGLHGLEPGHSKTMMAAFIIAIRGTVTQAVLLGLSATISHTAIVWVIAIAGLHFGKEWNMEANEPYFQIASAVLILTVAFWMIIRTYRHQHNYNHSHSHGEESKIIDTGHGLIKLEIFEEGMPPHFRLYSKSKNALSHYKTEQIAIRTERADGTTQIFTFIQREDFMESINEIPEPHEFVARLELGHGGHSHDFDVEFVEHNHGHHAIPEYEGLDVTAPGYQDPHELAHADDIRRRFSNKEVTTGQIILFGLTGGLIPCPATITILLICLQLKKVVLGAILVLCFSIGLALTMVATGTIAALSVKHVSKRWSGFGEFTRKAPYMSGILIILVGLYIGYQGLHSLNP